MTLAREILSYTPRACVFAVTTGAVVFYYDLLAGLEYVVALVAVLLVIVRPVSRVLPGWLRAHSRTIPLDTRDQLALAETRTTAGGVALVAVVACLTTNPLRSAQEDYEAAIIVMVILTAVFLFLCRGIAQDALSALRHGPGDASPQRHVPARHAQAFADISIAMMLFTAGLVIVAVL